MPTVRQIAERAGVSISTVSLALNNKKGVADATRQRVLNVASELAGQEREHGAARRGPDRRPRVIMVLHPAQVDDDVFTAFLRGIWSATVGTSIQLQMTVNDQSLAGNGISHLFFSDVDLLPDGLLALGVKKRDPIIDQARRAGVPCVLVQRETEDPGLSAVGVDEAGTARTLTDHLLNLGHTRIGFCGAKDGYSFSDSRLLGYRQAMSARGIEVPDPWVSMGWDRETACRLLTGAPELTAIVFLDDGHALHHGIPAIQAAGLRIPEDVSVASIDNIREAQDHEPPITSMELPFYDMSRLAVRILTEQLDDPMIQSQHIRLNAFLHPRASCAPPRRSAT